MQEIELLVSTENGSIVTNIDGIKKHIAAGLEEYKHMVFTEETKKEAKARIWQALLHCSLTYIRSYTTGAP